MSFSARNKEFSKALDVAAFVSEHADSIRYLLVRSLDKPHLQQLVKKNGGAETTDWSELYEFVFGSKITNKQLVQFIRDEYPDISKKRRESETALPQLVKNFGEVHCGLRNDRVDDLVKTLVRDKGIKSRADLETAINTRIATRIREYALWSFFNQATNDLIEHFFNDAPNVIPTLRKIPNVDFFLEVEDKIIPFDLKITHISEDYFDLHSIGLVKANGADSYLLAKGGSAKQSENVRLRTLYKSAKAKYALENMSGMSKEGLVGVLENQKLNDKEKTELKEIISDRQKMTKEVEGDAGPLEFWNYKEQGPRLFCNNNRFFVFLAYENSLADARPLKGQLDLIGTRVTATLKGIKSSKAIKTVKYHYDKEAGLTGDYEVCVLSVVVVGKQ
jgi:hypothetical protein